jgi:4-amino-4-deoxy-L-arabinose transferase-like glycosyltransferase
MDLDTSIGGTFHTPAVDPPGKQLKVVGWIVLLALAIRLLAAVLLRSWEFPEARDHWAFGYEMGRIAASLAQGHGFSYSAMGDHPLPWPTAWMAPAYPFIMAIAFKAFGVYTPASGLALVLFQAVLSSLTCAVVFVVGRRLLNPQVGTLAALFLAIDPASIHFSVEKIGSSTLFALFLYVLLLAFHLGRQRTDLRWGLMTGVALGLTVLVNPIIVAVIPFVVPWLLLDRHRDRRRQLASITLALVAAVLVVSPWLGRNYAVFGRFVFVKSNFGHELYLGNNIHATGGRDDPRVGREPDAKDDVFSPAELRAILESDEATAIGIHTDKALEFIQEHPLRFVALSSIRAARYWTFPTGVVRARDLGAFAVFALLTILAVVGAVSIRELQNLTLPFLFVLSMPLPYYLTVVAHHRYRYPVEVVLLLPAAAGLHWIWQRRKSRVP